MTTPTSSLHEADAGRRRLQLVRVVSAAVTVLSVVGLGLIALASPRTVTKHTTVTRQASTTARPRRASPPATTSTDTAPVDPVSTGLVAVSPLGSTTLTPVDVPSAPLTGAAVSKPSSPVGSAPAALPGTVSATLPACPFPLPTPKASGGLASLIGLSPLFGPFSAEAFASAAAFQPVLQLFGPFLVEFASAYASAEPSLAPLITQVETLENEGFSVLSPLYGPHRTQVLKAETTLASALAPYAQRLASNAASSCVVDIEGILTVDSAA